MRLQRDVVILFGRSPLASAVFTLVKGERPNVAND